MEVDGKDAAGGGGGNEHSISQEGLVGLVAGGVSPELPLGKAKPIVVGGGIGILPRSSGNGAVIIGGGGTGSVSDEDDQSFEGDGGEGGLHGRSKKTSPWQRMKWTDSMVKLLIGVVLYVGEDSTADGPGDGNKRKSGLLQKKGKWKSVSKVMMEKGCYVSPQQCEDKFNDLNKRYKRLNDILGKTAACSIVETPSVLDTMTNLLPKSKEDVKKILSSKHLFYKEMSFYHSGNKAALSTDLEFHPSLQAVMSGRELDIAGRHMKDDMDEDDEEDDDNEDVDDEFDIADGVAEDGDAVAELSDQCAKRRKLAKKLEEVEVGMVASRLNDMNGLEIVSTELMGALPESCSKATKDQQLWIRSRTIKLEEQKVGLQAEAFNLEKQKFKWQKFSCKKDRELERLRLENERMKLENERIQLEIKQKELEMDSKRSEASMTSIALILDKLQTKEQNELGRGHPLKLEPGGTFRRSFMNLNPIPRATTCSTLRVHSLLWLASVFALMRPKESTCTNDHVVLRRIATRTWVTFLSLMTYAGSSETVVRTSYRDEIAVCTTHISELFVLGASQPVAPHMLRFNDMPSV
ncbi:hypothetical protein R1flu_009308 [Riccia fluitans]|uniref:Myb/SANT-like DNA-binding domain-containing protein n=1 Tax=Riccia fluitans TaxID=41844 RepID=A0ABD1Z1Q8_9MARC